MHNKLMLLTHRAVLPWLVLVCLALALVAFPGLASADAPAPLEADPGKCALCHQAEVQDWRNSPHAGALSAIGHTTGMMCEEGEDCSCLTCHTTNFSAAAMSFEYAGVTCEACHGPYVEGHPENGEMVLNVDSSVCSGCHVDTFEDWQHTSHAEAGVQCIGCHRSHTQNLRLDDEVLCKSCHRDQLQDAGHLTHIQTGINCVNCHTSPSSMMTNTDGPSSPSHQFAVNNEVCAGCHGDSFHRAETSAMLSAAIARSNSAAAADATERALAVAEQESQRSTVRTSLLSLGLGIGIGVMGGIVFILLVAVLIQRPWRAKS